MTRLLNAAYDALVAQVHRYGGSVIAFSGDSVACWFEGDFGLRAGDARDHALFTEAHTSDGGQAPFSVKVGLAVGPVRRFLMGDPKVQRIDVLAGAALERMAQAAFCTRLLVPWPPCAGRGTRRGRGAAAPQ